MCKSSLRILIQCVSKIAKDAAETVARFTGFKKKIRHKVRDHGQEEGKMCDKSTKYAARNITPPSPPSPPQCLRIEVPKDIFVCVHSQHFRNHKNLQLSGPGHLKVIIFLSLTYLSH